MCIGVSVSCKEGASDGPGSLQVPLSAALLDQYLRRLDGAGTCPPTRATRADATEEVGGVADAGAQETEQAGDEQQGQRWADMQDHVQPTTQEGMDPRLLEKTRLCKFYARGGCARGSSCKFAHGRSQLRAQPDLWRTQLCFDFLNGGTCSYGEDCRYAHSMEELRSAQMQRTAASNPRASRRNRKGGGGGGDSTLATRRTNDAEEARVHSLRQEIEALRAQTTRLQEQLTALQGSSSTPTAAVGGGASG